MKMTLLEMVQDILSDMDSDTVNSIFDTIESEQVAQILKSTFLAMMTNREWPHLKQSIQLNPFSDPARPTHMALPDDVSKLVSLNYNCARLNETRKLYRPMKWREPQDFLIMTNNQNNDSDNVDIILDTSGVELFIRNDLPPSYFTSFNDKDIIFNSYDSEVDNTLQNSKIQALAYVLPEWTMTDTFVPDLPSEAFAAFLNEAKSVAMFRLKQMQDVKAEQESRRQQRWLSQNSWKVRGGIGYPNYGRNSRKYRRDPTFKDGDY